MVAAKIATMRRGDNSNAPIGATSQGATAELLNISRRSVQRAAKIQSEGTRELADAVQRGDIKVSLGARLAELPRSDQREILGDSFDRNDILTAARALRQQDTEKRRADRLNMVADKCANNRDLNGGPFAVILGDPPWQYQNNASDSRKVENHYPTLTLEEICALPVPEIAHKDSILFLWVPSPLIPEGVTVLNAWGFSYRTQFAWDKKLAGMGYYVRNQHECLFIGVKGKLPPPPTDARHPSVIQARRREHSRKPEEAYEILEAMYPGLPKVELFARNTRDGWAAWGNEIEGARHGH